MFILLVAFVGLAAAHQTNCSLDCEKVTATDQVIYVNGNFSYTLYAQSLAEEESDVELDDALLDGKYTIDPNIAEDARLLTPQLIRKYGYPAEIHRVQTSDGYILELHRIPGSRTSPPQHGKLVALLQHGFLDSSAGWIIMGPHQGLGYWLADLGYDVWLGNSRGNRYSRAHRSLNPDGNQGNRSRFWDFSFHEMGRIDLPTVIDYITQVTGQRRMHYIGHSQGCGEFFVMASLLPSYNDRIISMNALAPAVYLGNLRSPVMRALVLGTNSIDAATSLLGLYELLPSSDILSAFGERECRNSAPFQALCSNLLFLMVGFDSQQLNATMIPVIIGHTPAGTSTHAGIHLGQLIQSKRFRQFDHGSIRNLVVYGSIIPTAYNLRSVRAPVTIHYGQNDWLVVERDVQQLDRELGNRQGAYAVPGFNHIDFLYATDARRVVYNRVITAMRRFE